VTAEARIGWTSGRQFYTARNRIYLGLKSGESLGRLAQAGAGLMLKAIRSGRLIETLRAICAGAGLYWSLPAAERKGGPSRLRPETAALIDALNGRHRFSIWDRIRHAWAAGAQISDRVSR
jgi:hypothetical protein